MRVSRYVCGNDVNHRSDNGGGMTTSQGLFVRQSLPSDVPELDVDGVIPGVGV